MSTDSATARLPEPWTPDELRAWLRLVLTPGVGNGGARRLLAQISAQCDGSAQAIFRASDAQLRHCVSVAQATQLRQEPPGLDALVRQTWHWLHHSETGLAHALLVPGDPRYPNALLHTADPPLMLYAIAPAHWLARAQPVVQTSRSIAIVGSRHPTAQGEDNARQFARTLVQMGWCAISGLATGVDAAAHMGALEARQAIVGSQDDHAHRTAHGPDNSTHAPHSVAYGDGSHFAPATVAVIGTGIDRVYPARHHALSHDIARQGCILSEFPLGTPPLPTNFPKRNRIISGLSCGTLVVEAALKSGSLITARLANEQGREVFAIPGSIHAPQSRGCHALIRQGAKLVETAQDIIEEIAAVHGLPTPAPRGASRKPPNAPHPSTHRKISHRTPTVGPSSPDASVPHGDEPQHSAPRLPAPPVPRADEHPLLQAMGYDPTGLDALSARTGLDAATLQVQLLELELDGLVAPLPGGMFQRTAAA